MSCILEGGGVILTSHWARAYRVKLTRRKMKLEDIQMNEAWQKGYLLREGVLRAKNRTHYSLIGGHPENQLRSSSDPLFGQKS